MRRQLPSSALKKADGFDACKIAKGFIFLFGCPRTAQLAREKVHLPVCCCLVPSSGSSLVFFCSPVTRLLLRFAQTLASDIAVAKDQEEACHCLLPPPSHPTVLPTWGVGADVQAGVPSPGHAIHGAAVVKGATAYHIWRRGRTVLPPTTPSHTQSSGL